MKQNCKRFRSHFTTVGLVVFLATWSASSVSAQTDFYNTDRGRPVQIEDAYVTERHAFELKLAPVRLERSNGGIYNLGLEPEIAYGILPRTQIEVGFPIAFVEAGQQRNTGLAGLDFSVMHNLNVETETVPALGVRADLLAPVGSLAAEHAYASFTGMATRTTRWVRFHVNGQYTAGPNASPGTVGASRVGGPAALEVSRWLVGGAIDKTYPLSALLITADFYGSKPIESGSRVEYTTGAGLRYQQSPTLALDAGIGRRLNGNNPAWFLTFGTAYAFGIRSLIPFGR
ncbi:MAG: hypothetical protein M3P00_08420 [Gemmatimonadota bacterium]|nr:hypothetical protein [Gemmatimonadota bacterium]